MICEKCGKQPATTHITRIVGGHRAEQHLCAACAKKQGLDALGGFELSGIWNSLFAEPSVREQADAVTCPVCGNSLGDIVRSGRVGCPSCYITFYDRLLPSVQRIHGKAQHAGKLPGVAGERARLMAKLEELKQELRDKINAQEYEECAALRDRIRELEEAVRPAALPAPKQEEQEEEEDA